jgi:hypothetical protein
MPYSACDECNRLFATDREASDTEECPSCESLLRPISPQEGRERFRAATRERCSEVDDETLLRGHA